MPISIADKIITMNRQLFNKKETIFIASNFSSDQRVEKNVLAAMLANFETLGYQFSKEDVKKMAFMSEEVLTNQVFNPLIDVLKAAKGNDVTHNLLFPDFPQSVQNLDIDTLSDLRFFSYFTTWYDEYLLEENPNNEGTMTSSLRDYIKTLNAQIEQTKEPRETFTEGPDKSLITIHLGEISDYYQLIRETLQSKTSLSDYDKEMVQWALENVSAKKEIIPPSITFKETWALVNRYLFEHQKCEAIDISNYKDFQRLLAALTENGDVSLSKKQHFRNFTNQERRELYQIFMRGVRNHPKEMSDSAINKYSKRFTTNVLLKRLHFDSMPNNERFLSFIQSVDTMRSQMSFYEEAIQNKEFVEAAKILRTISDGALLRHAKFLVQGVSETEAGERESIEIINYIKESCRKAPMDILFALKKEIENNFSAKDAPLKFYFARSKNVQLKAFERGHRYVIGDEVHYDSSKLSRPIQERFLSVIDGIIKEQLSALSDMGKVYVDENLKKCPIPVVGRSDSGKNRTVATGTTIPVAGLQKDKDVLRALLYKKGPKDGFFDFSCAFLAENYSMVGQVSWNNLKEEGIAWHSGDNKRTTIGVSEVIDINLSGLKEKFPNAKYIIFEGMAWDRFTTVNQLDTCFMTLSSVNSLEDAKEDYINNPNNVQCRIDLTGDSYANIPLIYDIDTQEISILNISTNRSLSVGSFEPVQSNAPRHFELPSSVEAIENYSYALALTTAYIHEYLPYEKPSIYDLAMMNIAARKGILVDNKEDADIIFTTDREDVGENQKCISVFDKSMITTEFMIPDARAVDTKEEKQLAKTSDELSR